MRRAGLVLLATFGALVAWMLALPETPLALPSEVPDETPMVDGRVRAIERVGTNVWVGGKFARVKQRDGTVVASVSNVAVFDSATDRYLDIAPELGTATSEVWDMALYGDDVLIAGNFPGPSSNKKNLVLVDGATGRVIRWYNSPALRSVLAAPQLKGANGSPGRVYGGGESLSAFDFSTGKKLWTRAKTTVDNSLRPSTTAPGYRDLELDGSTIWAACACDAVAGNPAKALVKLNTGGAHDASWLAAADITSWGMSLVDANGALYLGAAGTGDFLAEFSKANGDRTWVRDTSGNAQAVEVMDGQLVVGGHFWEVADDAGDGCGHGRSAPELDPRDECQTRKGIAAYSFEGDLEPDWDPVYSGRYSLVWALEVEGGRLHTGGEFTTVNGVTQTYYARLPAPEVADERPNFVVVMTDDLDERSVQDLAGIEEVMGSNGLTFENAFVNYALCCPSRVTFLRGQYPHNHGITGAPDSLEPRFRELGGDQDTVATWLNDAGYETKYLGKYLNEYVGPYIPLGWDEWFALTGELENNKVNDDGQTVQLTGNSTDAFADEATDFIRRSSAKPFFVMIGTRAPHRPPEVPTRHQNSFADAQLPTPPNYDEEDVSDKPAWVKSHPPLTQDEIDRQENLYRQRLRSMLAVEDLLRQTIATLQETGELDDTYLFFTSDNGFHMGNHRLLSEKKTPYEEDIGVPLMVRGPDVPAGEVREQMVVNNDFAPTIAELAGVDAPAFVDGRSFVPLLTDTPPSSWRTAFLEEGAWQPYQPRVPLNKGVRTQKHMFVEYVTGEYELYDLQADPYQLESMPRVGNEQLYSELEARLDDLRDCSAEGCREAEWAPAPLP